MKEAGATLPGDGVPVTRTLSVFHVRYARWHANSVACTMLARLQHSVSVLSAYTQYRAARDTGLHLTARALISNREYAYAN